MFNFSAEETVLANARTILESRLKAPAAEFLDMDSVKEYLRLHYAGKEREEFVVLYLDSGNKLIENETLFLGTLGETSVHVREVCKHALLKNAASVVIAHNHPSGNSTPSPADHNVTRQIRDALRTVDVDFIDHLVVGGKDVQSTTETEIAQRSKMYNGGGFNAVPSSILEALFRH